MKIREKHAFLLILILNLFYQNLKKKKKLKKKSMSDSKNRTHNTHLKRGKSTWCPWKSWNARGLANPQRKQVLNHLCSSHKHDLLFVAEPWTHIIICFLKPFEFFFSFPLLWLIPGMIFLSIFGVLLILV